MAEYSKVNPLAQRSDRRVPDAFLFAAHASMPFVNQKQVLISQASRGDGVWSLLIGKFCDFQHINALKTLGKAEQSAT